MEDPEQVKANIKQRIESLAKETRLLVDPASGILIGENPSSDRIHFPNDATRPFEIIEKPALMNVASPGNGPCIITPTSTFVTHYHAGGHADTPLHLGEEYRDVSFHDSQYNGHATVVDLSGYFTDDKIRTITLDILKTASKDFRLEYSHSRRLLFKTYSVYPETWDGNAAHFDRESAEFLADLDYLVQVGIDTQSVDFHQGDIHKGAHGALIGNGIALLEGIRFDDPAFNEKQVHGILQTIWNPYQLGEDAKGATILFYKNPLQINI